MKPFFKHALLTSKPGRKSWLLGLAFFVSACASSSFFISYPQQLYPQQAKVINGQASTVGESLAKKGSGPNALLDILESARLLQIASSYSKSSKQFEKAFALFNAEDKRATLSLSQGGSLLSSFALNDNAIPYKAEAYERIFAYHYQSLNYLAQNNLEGAMVEVRRANEEQVYALEQHHKELAKAERDAQQEQVSPDIEQYRSHMSENFNTASKVKNSFQNAYTFYYSGIIREASGELNGAYIDYKKALEIYPDNDYVQADVWRLAKKLRMDSDMDYLNKIVKEKNRLANQAGQLIIFYEEGFVPAKEEVFLPFSSFTKTYTFAFPVYLKPWTPNFPIRISADGKDLGDSNEIIDTHTLAAKALQEGAFSRILRQMIRLRTKAQIQQEALKQNDNGWAQFFASSYSILSEQADMRSWLSLPKQVQVARFNLSPGSHTIHFSKATFSYEINVTIEPGKTNLIRLTNPGNQELYNERFTF